MTPKEKAEELLDKMCNANYGFIYELDSEGYPTAKQCALIAVDEILFAVQDLECEDVNWDFWQEVKNEIHEL